MLKVSDEIWKIYYHRKRTKKASTEFDDNEKNTFFRCFSNDKVEIY
jgi:hypothetical protein